MPGRELTRSHLVAPPRRPRVNKSAHSLYLMVLRFWGSLAPDVWSLAALAILSGVGNRYHGFAYEIGRRLRPHMVAADPSS